jgi:hypothetical protein
MNRRLQETQLKRTFSTNLVNQKLSHKSSISAIMTPSNTLNGNPWSPDDVDKLEPKEFDVFKSMIEYCRFFYQRDSLASVVINKMVDIGINRIVFNKKGLTDNELKIFLGLENKLKEFAEEMAMEFLLSGLVIPEVKYTVANKQSLNKLGIKNYSSLQLPTTMWLRDPKTVEIKPSLFGNEPTYYVEIPKEVIQFILSEGKYSIGEEDKELYIKLLSEYPEFVTAVRQGLTKLKLENPLIFRRRVITGKAYPTSYLSASIESLRHKRNLRRMDYSIAARVISAIQLFKLGSDDFPVTEEDGDVFTDIKNQMMWRDSGNRDIERVFQLFANHTLDISWVFPPTEALLDDKKYSEVNKDILLALGVSKTLLTGEAERTGASDPELSTVSAVKTMENFRDKIITVLKDICREIADRNSLKSVPEVKFRPLNLAQFQSFSSALADLYSSGNVSRHEYANYFGYDWDDEMDLKEKEDKVLKEKKIGPFAPAPFSPPPGGGDTNPDGSPKKPAEPVTKKPTNNKTQTPESNK